MKRILHILTAFIDRITFVGAVMGGVFTAVMTVIVTYSVVVRYIFNRPIGWSEEISIYFMIWAIFLGTAYALKEDSHISVDLLMQRLPGRVKPWFLLFHYVVGLAFLSLLFYKAIGMVNLSHMLNSRSIALDLPLILPQLAVPVGSAMLILQLLAKIAHLGLRPGRGR